jgi:PAS domain S-box-containing protein
VTDESRPSTALVGFCAEDILGAVGRAIVVTDRHGTIVFWNDGAEALYRWTAGEALGRRVTDLLVPPALSAEAEEIFARVLAGEEWAGDFAAPDKDGTIRWIAVVDRPIRNPAGEVVGVVGISEDVSSWRRVEAELAQSREDLSQALEAERAARTAAEAAAFRLASLQAVTAELSRAVDVAGVAGAILGAGVSGLGGRTGSLCLLAPGGAEIEIAHQTGYPEEVTRHWHSFPLGAALPASDAVRSGQMILVSSPAERDQRYPVFRDTPVVPDSAFAVVPLIDAADAPFGSFVIGFAEPRLFSENDRRFLAALADQCAAALSRARLYEAGEEARAAEARARGIAERAQYRLAFLAEASAVLASSLDYGRTLEQVAELAVPRLADWCAVYIADISGDTPGPPGERGGITPVAIAHVDPDRVAFVRRMLDRFPVNAADAVGIPAVMRSGRSEFYPVVPEDLWEAMAENEEHLDLLRSVGFGSGMLVPLRAGRRTFGAITLATDAGRRLEPEDLSLAEELAARAATAIDNARLFTERTRIARSLQSSLLPPTLPELPDLQLGARYVAAGRGIDVGGDFYDVFAVSPGCWVLALGDVCGKGVDAAAVSGLARHTIRSAAVGEASPSGVLSHLNQVLLRQGTGPDETQLCTALVITASPGPAAATLVVSAAGHPLPLLRRAGGEVTPVGRPGSLLGALPDGDWAETVVKLGPGDALVCFTDGITERHEGSRFFDEAGVADAVRDVDGTADELAAAVESAARDFVEREPVDDMAVLVLRVPADPALAQSDVA